MATLTIRYKMIATSFDVFHGEAPKIGAEFFRTIYKGTGNVDQLIKEGTWSLFKAMIHKGFKFTHLDSLDFIYSET